MMAVFNGEPHLPTALDSMLAQTFRDFEVIAIDDGSTDQSAAILAAYASRDRRVRVIRNDGNRGLVYTRNRAVNECRSPLLAIADADDVFAPDRLQRQVDFLQAHPEIGFVGSNAILIDGEGSQIAGLHQLPEHDPEIRFELLLGGCFWNTATVYRTELIRRAGGYRPGFDGVEDYDLWSRLLQVTTAANLSERLVCQRVHAGSFTAVLPKVLKRQSAVARRQLSRYLMRHVNDDEALAALTLFMYGWRMLMSRSDVALAVVLLREIAARADTREAPSISAAFRRRVARSLHQQARKQATVDRRLAVRLAGKAMAWDPTLVATKGSAFLMASLVTPDPVIEAARNVKRAFGAGRHR